MLSKDHVTRLVTRVIVIIGSLGFKDMRLFFYRSHSRIIHVDKRVQTPETKAS